VRTGVVTIERCTTRWPSYRKKKNALFLMMGPPILPPKLISVEVIRLRASAVVAPGIRIERRVVIGIEHAAAVGICPGARGQLDATGFA
jgi:hypothetical protein